MTKFLNISTDGTLTGNSDTTVVSEKAIKTYADTKQAQLVSGTNIKTVNGNSLLGSGDITISGSVAWGNITGTLSNQTDLQNALNSKADSATTLSGYGITDGANTNLSNLTSTGKNIANWSSNVSNCITYIPQDIKLELNNGTLTLKAGSKVYVPNGSGVFDLLSISEDKTMSPTTDGVYFVSVRKSDSQLMIHSVSTAASGTSNPSNIFTGLYYKTSDNKIQYYSLGDPEYQVSFPIAIITVSGGAISSIDQVFNGFGYIGSTVFVLPGVKGLIPDGRNLDGTLKNIEFTLSTVKTSTLQYDSEQLWSFSSAGNISSDTINSGQTVYYVKNLKDMYSLGITSGYSKCYVEETNRWYQNANTSSWTVTNMCSFAHTRSSSLKITSFNSKTDFHAIDYNDTSFIAHQAMPGYKSMNLTVGASGDTYTAPDDGWLYLYPVFSQESGSYCHAFVIFNNTELYGMSCDGYGNLYKPFVLPVSKGMTVRVTFNNVSLWGQCRWIFSNGAA